MGILAQFVANVSQGILKHDKLKQNDARKEAANKKKNKEKMKNSKRENPQKMTACPNTTVSKVSDSSVGRTTKTSTICQDQKISTSELKHHILIPDCRIDESQEVHSLSSRIKSHSLGSGMISTVPSYK